MNTEKQPNIVLILVDDMGYSDIGCYGSEISTPNLDRLASEGTRFTQYYNCARCCPSRASLLTGLYPHQTGVGFMVGDNDYPAYRGFLTDNCLTLGEVLKTAGYQTLYSGKWHTGGTLDRGTPEAAQQWDFTDPTKPTPFTRGFDRWYGTPVGATSFFNIPLVEDNQLIPLPENFFTTDSYTSRGIDYISDAEAEGKPWFLHLCYNAPHWPLHAHAKDVEKYAGKYAEGWEALRQKRHQGLKDAGIINPEWNISDPDPDAEDWNKVPADELEWQQRRMEVYAAQVECMDRNVGRLMDALEAKGILDDTIIFFLSDNGGCAEGISTGHNRDFPNAPDGTPVRFGNDPKVMPGPADTFQSYGLSWANASNSPFRMFKHFIHEGGISTPLIVRYPKGVKQGAIVHEPCHLIDMAPTLYDWAGADYSTAQATFHSAHPLEGRSMRPILERDATQPMRQIFWEHEGNAAVREGKLKAVKKNKLPWELYDMSCDRTETHDLAQSQPETLARLVADYDVWAARCEVLPFPIPKKAE